MGPEQHGAAGRPAPGARARSPLHRRRDWDPTGGRRPSARRRVCDIDAIGIIELLAGLNEGIDSNGLQLAGKTTSRSTPGSTQAAATWPALPAALASRSPRAGASSSSPGRSTTSPTSSACSTPSATTSPVFAAIRPLSSHEEAGYLAHEVPDVDVPEACSAHPNGPGVQRPMAGWNSPSWRCPATRPAADNTQVTPRATPVDGPWLVTNSVVHQLPRQNSQQTLLRALIRLLGRPEVPQKPSR